MFPHEQVPSVLKDYEILERLGVGGASEVYLARSPGGRLVAIKVLGPREDPSSDSLAREAAICTRLSDPCIVALRALLEDDACSALVFEYVPGVALVRVLRLAASRGVRLPDPAAFHICERVLSALACAHALVDAKGRPTPVVHRDLSPSNVLLDWEGQVKLADFGLAKMLGAKSNTRLGLIKGTPGWMAPEQARGEPVTERADVYAAGLLAWRLLTGRSPLARWTGDEFELLRAMRSPRIKPLAVLRPDLPRAVLDVVQRSLEPDPEKRLLDAEAFRAIMAAYADVQARQTSLSELLAGWRGALEQAVSKAPETDVEHGLAVHTTRYEEAALAFDTEEGEDVVPAVDLPSDAALGVAACLEDPDVESFAPEPPKKSGPRLVWIVVLLVAVVVLVVLLLGIR